MKYPTDFRQTVAAGVDPRLPLLKSHGTHLDWKLLLRSKLTSHDKDATIVLLCCTKFYKNLEVEFQDIFEFMRKVNSNYIITYHNLTS